MKSPQRGLDPVSAEGLCPVSTWSFLHRFTEDRKGSQDTSIDPAPSPMSFFPLYLPSHPPPAQRGKAGVLILVCTCVLCLLLSVCVCMFVCVHFLRAGKADTVNPGSCLRGFTSHCVRPCSGDGRKLFIGLQMLEWAWEIFLFHHSFVCVCVCVCSSRKLWWLLIFSSLSVTISLSVCCAALLH